MVWMVCGWCMDGQSYGGYVQPIERKITFGEVIFLWKLTKIIT